MQTKHLYFTDRSKAVLLLWIFYVFALSCFCYVFVRVCLYVLCGHLLTSWLSFVVSTVSLSLSHWYPGSGVVLDCIDSWSLHPYWIWSTSELRVRLAPWNRFKPSSKTFLLTVPKRYFFYGSFACFKSCVCHALVSAHCCLVVTCWERAGLLALVCDV